jgi:hypothetical protein
MPLDRKQWIKLLASTLPSADRQAHDSAIGHVVEDLVI